MNINKNNYEIFFIDYYDNQLTREDIVKLMEFLDRNPELKTEFEEYEEIKLPVAHKLSYPNKASLKKPEIIAVGEINTLNYEPYLIGELEGDLNALEQEQLNNFLDQNPSLKTEQKLLKHTKLTPDNTINYSGKNKLKKHPFVYLPLKYTMAAAASIILLLTAYFFLHHQGVSNENKRLQLSISGLKTSHPLPVETIATMPTHSHLVQRESPMLATIPVPSLEERNTGMMINHMEPMAQTRVRSSDITFDYYLAPRFNAFTLEPEALLADYKSPKRKSLFGKIITGTLNKLTSIFKQNMDDINNNTEKITWYHIASKGIDGYNFLTDKNIKLNTIKDEGGNVTGYTLQDNSYTYYQKARE